MKYENGMSLRGFEGFDQIVDNAMGMNKADKVPLYFANGEQSRYYSIMNITEGKEVCTVSDKYGILQHVDAVSNFITGIQSAGIEGQGRLRSFGDTISCDVIFDNFVIREQKESFDGSEGINLGVTMRNSFNKSVGFSVYPFMLRSVCSNGMIFKQKQSMNPVFNRLYVKHIGDVIGRVGNGIKDLIENMFKIENAVLNMIDVATNDVITFEKREDMVLTLGKYVKGERRALNLIQDYDIPLSVNRWDLYQVLTEYASWNRELKYSVYDGVMEGAETILTKGLKVEKAPLLTV